jgi:hypothetical protein
MNYPCLRVRSTDSHSAFQCLSNETIALHPVPEFASPNGSRVIVRPIADLLVRSLNAILGSASFTAVSWELISAAITNRRNGVALPVLR